MSETHVQYPGYVKAASEWKANAAQYATDPLFYAQQIVEPQQYASIGQPFVDLEKDISRGRKGMDDLDAAIETWQRVGRRRAPGVLPGHPGPAELMSLSELVRRRPPG